jgi:hypothetical protein
MKIVALLLLTSCACRPLAWSQVLGGLFDQQATELKYYQQQIAYLEIYIGYLEKGYKIAQAGLSEIAAIKKGEFNLHQEFFSSLASVSPAIARDERIAGILTMQLALLNRFKKMLQQTSHFSSSEIAYLRAVYSNIARGCSQDLTALEDIITSESLSMTDDERIRKIDQLYSCTRDKYAFTQSFAADTEVISAQRTEEENEIEFLNGLYLR